MTTSRYCCFGGSVLFGSVELQLARTVVLLFAASCSPSQLLQVVALVDAFLEQDRHRLAEEPETIEQRLVAGNAV